MICLHYWCLFACRILFSCYSPISNLVSPHAQQYAGDTDVFVALTSKRSYVTVLVWSLHQLNQLNFALNGHESRAFHTAHVDGRWRPLRRTSTSVIARQRASTYVDMRERTSTSVDVCSVIGPSGAFCWVRINAYLPPRLFTVYPLKYKLCIKILSSSLNIMLIVDKHCSDASAVTNFRCHKLIAKVNK